MNFFKTYPKWSMTFLLDEVVPQLLNTGVAEEQVRTMMYDNVRCWFEGTYELPTINRVIKEPNSI